MRLAVLSDIHGNIFALETCLKKLRQMEIDGIIWCGDYITDIPRSHEVIVFIKQAIHDYPSWIIRGNREAYILNHYDQPKETWYIGSNEESLLIAEQSLTAEDIAWLQQLPTELSIEKEGYPTIYITHKPPAKEISAPIVIYGHTHIQTEYYHKGSLYINPGSVGLPLKKGPGTSFAVLDYRPDFCEVKMYHVRYQTEKAIAAIQDSPLKGIRSNWDEVLIKTIQTGVNYIGKYIGTMQKIALANGYPDDLDHLPKEYWDQGKKEVGL